MKRFKRKGKQLVKTCQKNYKANYKNLHFFLEVNIALYLNILGFSTFFFVFSDLV